MLQAVMSPASKSFGVWVIVQAVLLSTGCGASRGSIGAVLGQNNHTGRVTVRRVPADMNASKAGITVGDELLTIDGIDVRAMSSEQIHEALQGPIGSQVSLTLRRGEDIIRAKVKRGVLQKIPTQSHP